MQNNILVGKYEYKGPHWSNIRRWEDNIKMDLKEGMKIWSGFMQLIIGFSGSLM
jgi:hypothetical protein